MKLWKKALVFMMSVVSVMGISLIADAGNAGVKTENTIESGIYIDSIDL